ncbi:hypothetical protein ACN38_g4184, partial [Penicillium nordicum]
MSFRSSLVSILPSIPAVSPRMRCLPFSVKTRLLRAVSMFALYFFPIWSILSKFAQIQCLHYSHWEGINTPSPPISLSSSFFLLHTTPGPL